MKIIIAEDKSWKSFQHLKEIESCDPSNIWLPGKSAENTKIDQRGWSQWTWSILDTKNYFISLMRLMTCHA